MASNVKSDGRTTRWDKHRAARREEFVRAAVRAIDALGPDASVADCFVGAENGYYSVLCGGTTAATSVAIPLVTP